MAHLYPIQRALGQTNGGTMTLTFPQTPATGNFIYLAVFGYNGGITVPSDFTLVSANTSDNTYNATWLYRKTQIAGSAASYAVSANGDIRMAIAFEMSSAVVATYVNHGACAVSGNTISATGLTAYPYESGYRRMVIWEWDNRGPTYNTCDFNYDRAIDTDPVNYSAPFTDSTFASYHAGVALFGFANQSGSVNLTLSAAVNYPVFMEVVFKAAGPAIVGSSRNHASNSPANTASTTVGLASTPTAGNLLIAIVAGAAPSVSALSSTPDGFTSLNYVSSTATGETNLAMSVFTKVATGAETGITFGNLWQDGAATNNRFFYIEVTRANQSRVPSPTSTDRLFSGGSSPATFSVPTLRSGVDSTSLRVGIVGWGTRGSVPAFTPICDDLSGNSIQLQGGVNSGVSLQPMVFPTDYINPYGGAAGSASISLGGTLPQNSEILWLDFSSAGVTVTSGGVSVMWLF